MRQFKLWNNSKTASFDFNSQGILITDVSGLGISYNPVESNGVVVNYEKSFEQISLLANFGIKANAYTAFNSLATFISSNGKKSLILEYSVNGRTLYADVWLTRQPKSQKTNFNILSETLLFTRVTHWYQVAEGEVPTAPAYLTVENVMDENLELILTIRPTTTANFKITASGTNETVEITIPGAISTGTLISDAERKVVERVSGGQTTNGYNLISRAGDTFMVLGKGTYQISTNQAPTSPPLVEYKKWVID